ncbi:MAG: HEAT repeat domain-containing protein [Planctomycetota bacterium]|nr:HEAT repeat domain-containing protein [Planctomycetota bacterium]
MNTRHSLFLLTAFISFGLVHAEPKTIAIVSHRPNTRGTWGPLKQDQAFRLAAGVILSEHLSKTPSLSLLDWHSTSGTAGIVKSGLYIFQSGDDSDPGFRWKQWRELIRADFFVEYLITQKAFTFDVHTKSKTASKTIASPARQPKLAIGQFVSFVYQHTGTKLTEEQQQKLEDPETTEPSLLFRWAEWYDHRPNMYNDNPWGDPNASAAAIIQKDPKFMRGLAWALTMRLRPIQKRTGAGPVKKRIANPVDFDNHVLRVLDTRWAPMVLPSYRARLKDPQLLKDSIKVLASSEIHFEPADIETEEDDGLGLDDVKPTVQAKTTPEIRKNVCLALSGHRSPVVLSQIIRVLEVDENAAVRAAAAESLGGWPDDDDVEATLHKNATEDPEALVRLAAFESLAKVKALNDPRLALALTDKSAEVKQFAFSWLAQQEGASEKVRALVLKAMGGTDAELRVRAFEIAPTVFQKGGRISAEIKNALTSGSDRLQLAAMNAVSHFELRAMLPVIGEHLLRVSNEDVRTSATETMLQLSPALLNKLVKAVGTDIAPGVLIALARGIGRHGGKEHQPFVETLLKSQARAVRQAAGNALYRIAADNRTTMIRSMLVDPSMRANFSALRLMGRIRGDLLDDLVWAAERHSNEYVRARAMHSLDGMDHSQIHGIALRALSSSYWITRLYGADILTRRAMPGDAETLKAAFSSNRDKWLKLILEDALCKSEGRQPPERTRLRLGKRKHIEGGELPNGWQLWQGTIPKDKKEARKLVEEGYRFGRVFSAPASNAMWAMQTWEDSKGKMDIYLLHMRSQFDGRLNDAAPFMNHLMFFDEPHGPGGGNGADKLRAFLLEFGRPDLIPDANGKTPPLPARVRSAFGYWNRKTIGELSNFIVGVTRMTFGRQYPDIKMYPQTMTYFGSQADAYDITDTDGDYSWRYDHSNLFGHYGKTALMRAIHPDQLVGMVTWMGYIRPARFQLDRVFTDTKFPEGPWRPLGYMGTCAALALYAGGCETGFFNHVGLDPRSARGKDIGGVETFPLTPHSPALTGVINKRMIGGDRVMWGNRFKELDGLVAAARKPANAETALDEDDEEEEEVDEFLDEAEGKKTLTVAEEAQQKLDAEKQEHFMNAMIGVSWMNIFNCDVTRAMANLPTPRNVTTDTLLIFPRGTRWNGDGSTYQAPAIALADGFDMVPNYDCIRLVDLMRYDTLMLLEGKDGVTSELVAKVNRWLRNKVGGLLYLAGNLNTETALFPELTFDEVKENFPWEGSVRAVAGPTTEEPILDRRKKPTGKMRTVFNRLGVFEADGKTVTAETSRLRYTWEGDITPLLTHKADPILARWNAPAEIKAVVLFDGITEAGPAYTGQLERIILAADKARNASVTRKRHWGHIVMENDRWAIQVAPRGYYPLQKARPRQMKGVDIITGTINPLIQHRAGVLILKDYVGPYAGGKGDWAVMAASELKEMKLLETKRLRVHSKGVTRVTHIGEDPIKLDSRADFEEVENQLDVWKLKWEGKKAYSATQIPGGWELHFVSDEPVSVSSE